MKTGITLSAFAKYARLVLAYNIVVILWGVFLRASKSGDGCGQFWLTCNGEVVPSARELKTVIEFSHRISSGVAFVAVLALLIWAFHKFEKGNPVRKTALVSFVFIITEALVGAGLVLTGNTAEALTSARPFWAIGHLTNTFVLLAFLSLTAWFAGTGRSTSLNAEPKTLLLMGMAVIALLLVGMSGSVAALSSMLFPSVSVSEGIVKDFADSSHGLLRLRLSHPLLSIITSVYIIFLAGWLKRQPDTKPAVGYWSNILSGLIFVQVAFGALTLLTLGPIIMQLGHLLLADAIWISFVLMSANFFVKPQEAGNKKNG